MLLLINEPKNRVHIFYDYRACTTISRLVKNKSMPEKTINARRNPGFLSAIPVSAWRIIRISLPNRQPMGMVQTAGSQRDGTFSKS